MFVKLIGNLVSMLSGVFFVLNHLALNIPTPPLENQDRLNYIYPFSQDFG